MQIFIISLAGGICAASLACALWIVAAQRQDPMRQRMLKALSPGGSGSSPAVEIEPPSAGLRRGTQPGSQGILRLLGVKPYVRILGFDTFTHQLTLLVLLCVVGGGSTLIAHRALLARGLSPSLAIMGAALVAVAIVWFLTKGWVHWYTKRWSQQISTGLVNVLDLWVLCLGAGMSFQSAMVRVIEETELADASLREQLQMTNQEILAGAPREDALRHFARRCGNLPDVRSLVAHIIHAERLGGSLAQTLKIYASTLRFKRSQEVKELIQKLPVKLAVPLVFCILPVMGVLIGGPAILRIFRALASS